MRQDATYVPDGKVGEVQGNQREVMDDPGSPSIGRPGSNPPPCSRYPRLLPAREHRRPNHPRALWEPNCTHIPASRSPHLLI